VLGARSTKDPAFVLTGVPGSGSIYATHMFSPYEVCLFSIYLDLTVYMMRRKVYRF
jgi:hypothetical protein